MCAVVMVETDMVDTAAECWFGREDSWRTWVVVVREEHMENILYLVKDKVRMIESAKGEWYMRSSLVQLPC